MKAVKLLVLDEKHEERYFAYDNVLELNAIKAHVVIDRYNEEYWYTDLDEKEKDELFKAIQEYDEDYLVRFFNDRQKWEYEDSYTVTTETLS